MYKLIFALTFIQLLSVNSQAETLDPIESIKNLNFEISSCWSYHEHYYPDIPPAASEGPYVYDLPKSSLPKFSIAVGDHEFLSTCGQKCRENFEKVKEKVSALSKEKYAENQNIGHNWDLPLEKIMTQELYESADYKKRVGWVLRMVLPAVRIGDDFYITENYYEDYQGFYKYRPKGGKDCFTFPVIKFKETAAIWISELKKAFFFKVGNLFDWDHSLKVSSRPSDEARCNRGYLYLNEKATLYDASEKKINGDNLKGLLFASYRIEKDRIVLGFFDTHKPMKSNVIDGLIYSSNFLLNWYGYDKQTEFYLKKEDIVMENGKLALYSLEPEESFAVNSCPYKAPDDALKDLRSGKLSFKEAYKKYEWIRGGRPTKSIFYDCVDDLENLCGDSSDFILNENP